MTIPFIHRIQISNLTSPKPNSWFHTLPTLLTSCSPKYSPSQQMAFLLIHLISPVKNWILYARIKDPWLFSLVSYIQFNSWFSSLHWQSKLQIQSLLRPPCFPFQSKSPRWSKHDLLPCLSDATFLFLSLPESIHSCQGFKNYHCRAQSLKVSDLEWNATF